MRSWSFGSKFVCPNLLSRTVAPDDEGPGFPGLRIFRPWWSALAQVGCSCYVAVGRGGAFPFLARAVEKKGKAILVAFGGAALPERRYETAVVVTILILVGVRLACAEATTLSFDEALYWLWSQHIAGGYYDHPPINPILIRFGTKLFGNTEFGVRVFSVLLALPASWAIWRSGAILFKDERVGATAALYFNLTLRHGGGFGARDAGQCSRGGDGVSPVDARQALRTGRGAWWLAIGVAFGVGMLSKYTTIFFAVSILAWLLLVPELRKWLFTPWPWISGADCARGVFADADLERASITGRPCFINTTGSSFTNGRCVISVNFWLHSSAWRRRRFSSSAHGSCRAVARRGRVARRAPLDQRDGVADRVCISSGTLFMVASKAIGRSRSMWLSSSPPPSPWNKSNGPASGLPSSIGRNVLPCPSDSEWRRSSICRRCSARRARADGSDGAYSGRGLEAARRRDG